MKKLALGLLAVMLLGGCGTKEAKISMEEAKEAALKEFQGDIIQSKKPAVRGTFTGELSAAKQRGTYYRR